MSSLSLQVTISVLTILVTVFPEVESGVFGKKNTPSSPRNDWNRKAKDDMAWRYKKQQPSSSLNELLIVIFGDYHKELVPKRPTTVRLDLLLIKVKSTNEREGIFESVVALFIEWKDHRLIWQPEQYANTSVLAFDSDKVWLPDIAMTNSADHLYSISKDTRFVVRVTHDGTMKFVPTGTARTWCHLKLLTFPFDIQTCSFEFESWSLDSNTMTFNTTSNALVDDAFASPQWSLCHHQSIVYDYFYEFSSETFTRVRFDFVVRRKSTFYIINLIFPTCTLSLIQLLVFAIPSTDASSDRVAFGTTNLLTLVVFQTIITEEMPKSSDSVTALSKYIIALIIMSALGILESVAAERLLRPTTVPPPRWLLKVKLPLLWGTQLPTGIAHMTMLSWVSGLEDPAADMARNSLENSDVMPAMKRDPSIVIEYEDDNRGGCLDDLMNTPRAKKVKTKIEKNKSFKTKKDNQFLIYDKLPEKLAFRYANGNFKGKETGFNGSKFQTPEANYMQLPDFCSEDEIFHQRRIRPMQPSNHFLRDLEKKDAPYSAFSTKQQPSMNQTFVKRSTNSFLRGSRASLLKYGNQRRSRMDSTDEKALIQIGKEWGLIVTRIDGLTFAVCASLAIFLPVVLFLPLALIEKSCNRYSS